MKTRITRLQLCRSSRIRPGWKVAPMLGVLAAAACFLRVGDARALDQAIAGKKLWLNGSGRFVLLSKDAGIDASGFDPQCHGGDSSLVMHDGVNSAAFLLPCTNWRDHGSGTYRYRNPSAPGGPSAVKAAKIKSGYLKVVGKGLGGMPVPSGAGTIGVVLNLDGIAHRFCMSFTGTGDGSRFVARDAPAGSCPSPPPCDAVNRRVLLVPGRQGRQLRRGVRDQGSRLRLRNRDLRGQRRHRSRLRRGARCARRSARPDHGAFELLRRRRVLVRCRPPGSL